MSNNLVERSDYPISKFKEVIIDTLEMCNVLIITAMTGAGKSTQVSQYLIKAGYEKVIVAVPTRAAAFHLASRVAEELGCAVGELVGYQTAYEKCYSDATRIMYVTDGMELMKLLHARENLENSVLIIDEAHELTINVETLIAWAKMEKAQKDGTKVILMSATMDVEPICKYFDNCPVINVPGKLFPISMHRRHPKEFVSTIYEKARDNHNVLAFVPGKSEINETIIALKNMDLDSTILPFHADLPPSEQQNVFKNTDNVKIVVATNIAETSLTIEGITVVVDQGLERHMENIDGVDTLTVGPISKSNHIQRMGRAGRTQPGEYYYCGAVELSDLEDHRPSDMLTSDLCQIVLKLASIDINAHEVEFLHQPPIIKIEDAQRTLRTLGAFDEDNHITECGMIMAQLPVSVRYARMLVEAYNRDVLADVATIAAIAEVGGIKKANITYENLSDERKSDLLAEFDAFNGVRQKLLTEDIDSDVFARINERNYYRVLELRTKIFDKLYIIYGDVSTSGNRNEILKSCAAGMVEFLYVGESNGWYLSPNDPYKRKLNIFSTTLPGKYILGLPQNISLAHKDVIHNMLHIIRYPIMVDPNLLEEIAPHLISEAIRYDYKYDTNEYFIREVKLFGAVEIASIKRRLNDGSKKKIALATWLAKKTIEFDYNAKPDVTRQLHRILFENNAFFYDFDEAKEFYLERLAKFPNNSIPNLKKTKNLDFLAY